MNTADNTVISLPARYMRVRNQYNRQKEQLKLGIVPSRGICSVVYGRVFGGAGSGAIGAGLPYINRTTKGQERRVAC